MTQMDIPLTPLRRKKIPEKKSPKTNLNRQARCIMATVINVQQQRQQALDNFMVKIGFYGSLNKRQGKIMSRMFWPGPNDFKDGLTVEEYIAITDATPAAAKQDVTDLVARGLLRCIGDRLYRLKYNRLNA